MRGPSSSSDFEKQGEMLANRVQKRFRHFRKRFARQDIEVFRLYDWDIPEIRAVVDWYAGHLVIGEYVRRQSVPGWLPAVGAAVADALSVPRENLHLKMRKAGKQGGRRYERLTVTERKIIVCERDLKFLVNPWDFVDTGLFADHRNTRQMFREMARDKDVLNLFCYTGSFSWYAAKGGARTTVSVDRSEGNIRWASENRELNGIDRERHTLVHAQVPDFLSSAGRSGKIFDLAIVDPPSYYTNRNRNESFDLQKDHPSLLDSVLKVMRNGATVLFSTNHQDFLPRFEGLPACEIREITDMTIPEDYEGRRKKIHRCWEILCWTDAI